MRILVREMAEAEFGLVIDYFHRSAPEHLEMMGVDPTRIPPAEVWRSGFRQEVARPLQERRNFLVTWLLYDEPIGFSSCDKVIFGQRASMHLHVTEESRRKQGVGTECVRRSIEIYFRILKLSSLFCEPNAFNVAANRTLQRVGFKYVKTHMTVPGPFNYRQPVTLWVINRDVIGQ